MDDQRPDPEHGPSPTPGPRIEQDFMQPLRRTIGSSRLRLPAALPFAIAGILVVTSVAFGANMVRSMIASPNATPVVVGDDPEPTPEPTPTPTATPTPTPTPTPEEVVPVDPVVGDLMLSAEAVPGKVNLSWTKYTGADFAYYKVVRSTDATASWPLGDSDTLVAAIDNVDTLTFTDCSGAGTFTYEVFAVKSSDAGHAVLAASNVKTVTVSAAPTKTPAPVSNPANLGALRVTSNGSGSYTFSWNAYTGGTEFNYYKLSGVPYPETPGYAEGKGYWAVIDPGHTSVTVDVKSGTWNVNVEAIYYPGGKTTALAKTTTLKMTAVGPMAPPIVSMTLTGVPGAPGVHKVTLTWGKYTGPFFAYYGIQKTEAPNDNPTLATGDVPNFWYGTDVNVTSKIDTSVKGGHTYYYRVYAFTDQTLGMSGGFVPACNLGTILGMSQIIRVDVPPDPTPTANPTPTPTPTPTPEPAPTPTPTPTPEP